MELCRTGFPMITLERVIKLYHSKRLWQLSPPDKGAARRLVAQALNTPTAHPHLLQHLQNIQNLLTD
jgi:hypothetical protein